MTNLDLKNKLTEEEYRVTQEKGTEAPFEGKYMDTKDKGMYNCKVCAAELFSSDTKFDSGTGWPSFDQALPGAVTEITDTSHGMMRTEAICSKCGAHLGMYFLMDPKQQPDADFVLTPARWI